MEREALEHLLGRTRTDDRLDGWNAAFVTEEGDLLDVIMLSVGSADMITIGSSGARGAGLGHDGYPRE